MKFADLEAILFRAFDVQECDYGKFRARMRYFRKLGIPEVERPGKGRVVDFTQEHLCELVMAFTLASIGMSPTAIRDFVCNGQRQTVCKPLRVL